MAAEECGSGHDAGTKSCTEILFNPNVFTEFKLAGSQEVIYQSLWYVLSDLCIILILLLCSYSWYQEIQADEESVRKVSLYLKDVVLPKFNKDLCSLEVSPMDGQTLTDALHAHGINVRYIGKVGSILSILSGFMFRLYMFRQVDMFLYLNCIIPFVRPWNCIKILCDVC